MPRRGPGGLLLDGRLGQLQIGHQPTTRGEGGDENRLDGPLCQSGCPWGRPGVVGVLDEIYAYEAGRARRGIEREAEL